MFVKFSMLEKKLFGYGNATVDDFVAPNTPYDGMKKPGGIMNVARGWQVLSKFQRKNPVKVYMVGNYGDDEDSKVIQETIEKDEFNTEFFLRLRDAESRVYKINLSNPEEPDIQRYKEGKALRATPKKNIIPFLDNQTLVFAQSFGTFLESQGELMISIYNIARRKGAETASDANIRQSLIDYIQGRDKTVSSAELEDRQKIMIARKEMALRELSMLKVDDAEAKILDDDFKTDKPIKEISVQKSELPKIGNSILSTYDSIRMLAITKGKEGGYFLTRDFETFYDAVKLDGYVNSLGCGDGYSAAMTFGRLIKLSDTEIAALSPIIAALYTKVPSGYPDLTPESIRDAILKNDNYCKNIGANSNEIITKMENITS